LKKKSDSKISKDPSKSHFLSKHGIIFYPISESEYKARNGFSSNSKMWLIEVNNNGNIKTFSKKIQNSEIDDALWKTINYYYELLTEKSKTKK